MSGRLASIRERGSAVIVAGARWRATLSSREPMRFTRVATGTHRGLHRQAARRPATVVGQENQRENDEGEERGHVFNVDHIGKIDAQNLSGSDDRITGGEDEGDELEEGFHGYVGVARLFAAIVPTVWIRYNPFIMSGLNFFV